MIDSGHMDEKIIAIPYNDPNNNMYKDISELPHHIFSEMRHFFSVYKPLVNKETVVREAEGAKVAQEVIRSCIQLYKDKFGE